MSIEILAPAGSKDALQAAVRSGCDAVYLGFGNFNARRNAANFDEVALIESVKYCHARNVKVYLTLNTLVSDDERAGALFISKTAVSAGVDAVILQDLGLSSLIKQASPKLDIHASTQMTVHSHAALKILKEIGFSRVIASREMDRKSLKELCFAAKELDIEVEHFTHGALCMSMSGQCLLSAMLGGRSGNRGLCAQPCRLPFTVEGGTGHDLSLKDLSLIDHIKDLESIGVSSLKIEGRMKRPEYVAAATQALRLAADGEIVPENLRNALKDIFSRSGFTDGYYNAKIGREMFGQRTKDDSINTKEAISFLHGLYRTERQSIPVKITAEIFENKPITLIFSDFTKTVTVKGGIPEKAINRPLSKDIAEKQISKLGGTQFYAESIECRIDEGISLPMSVLNSLRREAVEKLVAEREKVNTISFNMPVIEKKTKPVLKSNPEIIARFESADQMPPNFEGITAISLPLESDFESVNLPVGVKLIIDIPRGILGIEKWVIDRLKKAKQAGFTAAFCGNLSVVELAQREKIDAIADFGMNVFNSDSLKTVKSFGAAKAIVSPELKVEQISEMSDVLPKGIIAYGRLPLMLMRNCPGKNGTTCSGCGGKNKIIDRKGIEFPLRCRTGFTELLNSVPIWLADRQSEFKGTDFFVLYFTDEDKNKCADVIKAYLSRGNPPPEFTRGLYYRGVE